VPAGPAPPEEPGDDGDLFRAATHDVRAFEAIYRRHVRRVTGLAVSRCSCAEDVADVVAQTFVRLLTVADRYDPERGEPAAFVLGIAANVVRDVQRRNGRQRALVERLAGRDLLEPDDIARIDAAIDAARAAPGIRRAIDAVPPGERAVLGLVAEGQSPGQAAHTLGITPAAARTRLSRARTRVRNDLTSTTDTETSR
jgi:RNA polymerase sigma-70 factor (ECF subfamily)